MTDILFDLETKIRQSLSRNQKLGVETGTVTAQTQAQAKKPEPEKTVPPKQPTPTPSTPQKIYVEGSPPQTTVGNLPMIRNE